MPNTQDLRWQRTERAIMTAYRSLLEEDPRGRITVTRLAQEATINKATFYLHYRDLQELAVAYTRSAAEEAAAGIDYFADFFESPRSFASRFVETLRGLEPALAVLEAAGLAGQFVRHFDDAIDGALDGARRALGLPVAPRSPLITSFVVSGMISTFHRCAALPDGEFAAAFGDLLAALAAQGRAEAAGVDLVRGGGGSGNESGGPGEGL